MPGDMRDDNNMCHRECNNPRDTASQIDPMHKVNDPRDLEYAE